MKINKFSSYSTFSVSENFENRGIVQELKDLVNELKKDLNSGDIKNKEYSINNVFYKFDIKEGDINYSNVPIGIILEAFINDDKKYNIIIPIYHKTNTDKNYIISIMIHEVRHIYDVISILNENEYDDFCKGGKLSIFRKKCNSKYLYFCNLIYLSLIHELVARNNQVYPLIYDSGMNKVEALDMIKKTFIYESLEKLNSFNYKNFISKFDKEELEKITNEFKSNFDNSNQYDYNIEEYYKKWEEYFKSISKEWYVEMEKEIDRIYEYYPSIHEFLKSNRCESLLNFLYNKIFN